MPLLENVPVEWENTTKWNLNNLIQHFPKCWPPDDKPLWFSVKKKNVWLNKLRKCNVYYFLPWCLKCSWETDIHVCVPQYFPGPFPSHPYWTLSSRAPYSTLWEVLFWKGFVALINWEALRIIRSKWHSWEWTESWQNHWVPSIDYTRAKYLPF